MYVLLKERLTAGEEQRPSQGLRALPLFSYFFSSLCLVFHSSQRHALGSEAGDRLYRSVLALAVSTLMRAELQVLQRMCPSKG